MGAEAKEFVSIIKELLQQQAQIEDTSVTCQIFRANDDGTYDVCVLPDTSNVISRVINQTPYDFKPGDTAQLYLINGKTSNSFIIAKYNPKKKDYLKYLIQQNAESITSLQNKIEGLVDSENIITYTPQDPTNAEKESARGNIGVVVSSYDEFMYSKPSTQSAAENRQVIKIDNCGVIIINNKDRLNAAELHLNTTAAGGGSADYKLGSGLAIIYRVGNEFSLMRYSETDQAFKGVTFWKDPSAHIYLQVNFPSGSVDRALWFSTLNLAGTMEVL